MARDLTLWQGVSEERYPQRSLTERATPPQSQKSDRNVAYPAAQAVFNVAHKTSADGGDCRCHFGNFSQIDRFNKVATIIRKMLVENRRSWRA